MSKRVAIVGYGYWGPNLLRNFVALNNCEVVYCCDKDQGKLKGVHKNYPGITLTTDIGVALSDESVDAIIIATPTASHFPLAKQAIEFGKDVLIEKPMTLSFSEAKQLVELANRARKIVMVDHTFLFNDAVLKIKNLIQSGEIGDILYIDSVRVNLGLFQRDVNVIFDLASHDFSIINFILDSSPISVQAHANTHYGGNENVAYIFAEYPGEVTTHVHVSWLSPAKMRRMLIVGSKKMIVYDDIEPTEKLRIYDKGIVMEKTPKDVLQMKIGYRSGDVWLPKIEILEPLSLLAQNFIDSITSRSLPRSNGDFGARVVDILEKATKSARDKKTIMLGNGIFSSKTRQITKKQKIVRTRGRRVLNAS